MIKENLAQVLSSIREAEKEAGRVSGSVKLVAVSKTKPMEFILEAFAEGQVDFGENRTQELVEKHPQLTGARWHMIGRLQRNKVKYIAPFIYMIHSVDSERLLKEISKEGQKNDRIIPCLLQINISGEPQKGGFEEAEAANVLEKIEDFPGISIQGLMGMAEFTDDQEVIRTQFQRLSRAFSTFKSFTSERVTMKELSMGMTGDFKIAIAEGATLVRIGSAVFGGR